MALSARKARRQLGSEHSRAAQPARRSSRRQPEPEASAAASTPIGLSRRRVGGGSGDRAAGRYVPAGLSVVGGTGSGCGVLAGVKRGPFDGPARAVRARRSNGGIDVRALKAMLDAERDRGGGQQLVFAMRV